MDGQGSGRVYIGNLPADYTEKDVQKEFETFGSIVKIDLKKAANGNGYCFVEFEDPRDARDAIAQMHGRPPARDKDAPPLRVELPNSRRDGRGGRPATGVKRGNYIVEIAGLPPSGSWQDLKDHFRACGEVGYADVWGGGDPDAPRFGEVSFFSRRDMLEAIERLDGSTFCSHQNEKSRISVREKRANGMAEDSDEYDYRRGGGYSSNDGGYYSRTSDRRYGGGYGGSAHGYGGGSQGYGGHGYSRGYRSPSPRGGQDRGYDDLYHSDRGYGRGRSRSRERRPPSYGGYPPAPPPARHRGYDAPPRRYEEKGRS